MPSNSCQIIGIIIRGLIGLLHSSWRRQTGSRNSQELVLNNWLVHSWRLSDLRLQTTEVEV
jgi:hypothetical protein